jgi:hypothetical protein
MNPVVPPLRNLARALALVAAAAALPPAARAAPVQTPGAAHAAVEEDFARAFAAARARGALVLVDVWAPW